MFKDFFLFNSSGRLFLRYLSIGIHQPPNVFWEMRQDKMVYNKELGPGSEESDLYIITPLRYNCTAKFLPYHNNKCPKQQLYTVEYVYKLKTNIGICFVGWKLNTWLYLTLMFNLVTILSLLIIYENRGFWEYSLKIHLKNGKDAYFRFIRFGMTDSTFYLLFLLYRSIFLGLWCWPRIYGFNGLL